MNEIELWVFDINLNRLGIIDDFEEAIFEKKFYTHSICELQLNGTPKNSELLLVTDNSLDKELRVIVRSDEPTKGYIVEVAQFTDEAKTTITVIAYSLSVILNWRLVTGQQRFKGALGTVLTSFVSYNCITTEPGRIMPNLILGTYAGLTTQVDEAYANKPVDEILFAIAEKYDVSYEIVINHTTKKFVFNLIKGTDRSALQSTNNRIIFAEEFENVLNQSYTDDKTNIRNVAYVAGEGEGTQREVVIINNAVTGWNRREIFIDARDLQSEFDEDGETVTIPESEYIALLTERGNNKLQDYQRIQTFESGINTQAQFTFNEDYFLGDLVSNRNDRLNIIMHNRVVVAKETFNQQGYHLAIEFGTAIPTLTEKIKRDVK